MPRLVIGSRNKKKLLELQDLLGDLPIELADLSPWPNLHDVAETGETFEENTRLKATAYAKSVYDVTTATQAEIGKLLEEQVAEFNKQVVAALDKMVKTAPAGSEVGIAALKSGIAAVNSAYDNVSKVAKQFTEATQSNFEAVVKQAGNGAKKTKKAA